MERPWRKYEIEIKIGGDSIEDVIDEIEFFKQWYYVNADKKETTSISGSNHTYSRLKSNSYPDMTNEKYHIQLNEYIAKNGL